MVHLVVMVCLAVNGPLQCLTVRSSDIVTRERCQDSVAPALARIEADLRGNGYGPAIVWIDGICVLAELDT